MSNGYALVPPSVNTNGPYIWLTPLPATLEDIPEAPHWVVDMLRETVHEPRVAASGAPINHRTFNAPPVQLGPRAMDWWNGRRSCAKQDGQLDRSETLFTIGLCLASAGADEDLVAAAVADRDNALGYQKYSERSDGGDREYRRIATKALGISQGQALSYTRHGRAAANEVPAGSGSSTTSTLPAQIDWGQLLGSGSPCRGLAVRANSPAWSRRGDVQSRQGRQVTAGARCGRTPGDRSALSRPASRRSCMLSTSTLR
jgi:hypothetical protein